MHKAVYEKIRSKLLNLIKVTLSDKKVGSKIRKLLMIHNASVKELEQEVLAYTLDKVDSGYKNDRYKRTIARLTLYFHNNVTGTYHKKRHRLVESFLNKANPKSLMDIGYGVPGSYLINYLKKHSNCGAILLDQDSTAEGFAKTVLKVEAPKILHRINFQVYDMNSKVYPGDADVYLYLDSIEHTKNPTTYLNKIVSKVKIGSYFIFSLPIGSMKGMEGFHFAEWLSDKDAKQWVKSAGLKIIKEGTAYPNPKVDFFAKLTLGGYHNYLVLCRK